MHCAVNAGSTGEWIILIYLVSYPNVFAVKSKDRCIYKEKINDEGKIFLLAQMTSQCFFVVLHLMHNNLLANKDLDAT